MTAANIFNKFVEIVRACNDLPDEVRERADQARGVEESTLDQTYIDFLDEQILLGARGPEWTELLRGRRESIRSYCGQPLIFGRIPHRNQNLETWIRVNASRGNVVHSELFKYDPEK